jgi:hypothetical protein
VKLVESAIISLFDCRGRTHFFYFYIHEKQIVKLIKPTFGHNCAHVSIRVFHSKKASLIKIPLHVGKMKRCGLVLPLKS